MVDDTTPFRPAGARERGPAVVLLSGGLDSATCLALAHAEGYRCYGLTLRYGQRHAIEVERARQLAETYRLAEHRVLAVDLAGWGGSSLTGAGPIPHHENIGGACTAGVNEPGKREDPSTGGTPSQETRSEEIPSTYVPARNTILLSFALAWAEVLGAEAIFAGMSAVDYSGYPDCRPEFVGAFQALANVATKAGVEGHGPIIRAPLIHKSKAETIRWGLALGLDYGFTWSCYDPQPGPRPCGACDSCRLRARGFAEADHPDPLLTADGEGRGRMEETVR